MKILRYLLCSLLTFVFIIPSVLAGASQFEPTINMEPEIIDNQIMIIVGYRGEDSMVVTQELGYDATKLSLVDITPLESFTVTKSNNQEAGDYQTIKVLADSDYSYSDTNYAVVTFELRDAFKTGKTTDVFFYNYYAAGADKTKVRHKGYEMTLIKDSNTSMLFLLNEINSQTKIKYWFYNNVIFIIIGLLVIIGIIIVIFSIPSKRKKEHREGNMRDQIKQPNYHVDNIAPIKIDTGMIENFGKKEREINKEEIYQVSDINPFGGTTAESKFNQPTNENNVSSSVNVIDPFNTKINSENQEDGIKEIPEIPETKEEPFKEIKDNGEDLVLFQPMFDDDKKDDKIEMLSLLLALFVSLSLFIPIVKAEDYRVDELRDCLVGNIPMDKTLDYNDDGVVDILDLIETKDLSLVDTNPPVEEEIEDGNFAPIENHRPTTTRRPGASEENSNNNNSTTNKTTVATSNNVTNKTTSGRTTKKTTTKASTTSTKKYTVTLEYNNATAQTNSKTVWGGTSPSIIVTPNHGYMFSTLSCTNGQRATYSNTERIVVDKISANTTCTLKFVPRNDMRVNIKSEYGTVSPSTIIGTYKQGAEAKVTPKFGYEYRSVSCSNNLVGNYNPSTNILSIKSIINEGTCTVLFQPKKYTLVVNYNGKELVKSVGYYNTTITLNVETTLNFSKIVCGGKSVSLTKETISTSPKKYAYSFKYVVGGNTTCQAS